MSPRHSLTWEFEFIQGGIASAREELEGGGDVGTVGATLAGAEHALSLAIDTLNELDDTRIAEEFVASLREAVGRRTR